MSLTDAGKSEELQGFVNRESGKDEEFMIFEKYYEKARIRVSCEYLGEDLLVKISGGDKPHIGAVALSEDGQNGRELHFPTHKDQYPAMKIASKLGEELGIHVVCVCGIHYNDFGKEELEMVNDITETIISDIWEHERKK